MGLWQRTPARSHSLNEVTCAFAVKGQSRFELVTRYELRAHPSNVSLPLSSRGKKPRASRLFVCGAWSSCDLRNIRHHSALRRMPHRAAIQRTNISKRCNPMCDYSLHATASRPAKAGDKISTSFSRTSTRGFAAETDRNVAVCLMPGTELGFAENVKYGRNWFWCANTGFSVARFRKIEASQLPAPGRA